MSPSNPFNALYHTDFFHFHYTTFFTYIPFKIHSRQQYIPFTYKNHKKEKGHVPYPCHTRGTYITLHAIASKSSKPPAILINSLHPNKAIQLTLYINQCIQYDMVRIRFSLVHYTYTYSKYILYTNPLCYFPSTYNSNIQQ